MNDKQRLMQLNDNAECNFVQQRLI